jgi:hypothetical protein
MSVNLYDLINNTIIVGEETQNKSSNWWNPSSNEKTRVMLCGTYPIGTSNGYSKVVYYIAKYLGEYKDIALTIYGFQNVSNTNGKHMRNNIPSNVVLYEEVDLGKTK